MFHYFPRVGVVESETKAKSAQLVLGLGLSLAKIDFPPHQITPTFKFTSIPLSF
jgi:hypothetical protein